MASLHRLIIENHGKLYKTISHLEPLNFSQNQLTSAIDFDELSSCLSKFPNFNNEEFTVELQDFSSKQNVFKTKILKDNNDESGRNNVSADDENVEEELVGCKSCKHCTACCFNTLKQLNLHRTSYSNLYTAYKFVLTL